VAEAIARCDAAGEFAVLAVADEERPGREVHAEDVRPGPIREGAERRVAPYEHGKRVEALDARVMRRES
jgi:hypothetical protein